MMGTVVKLSDIIREKTVSGDHRVWAIKGDTFFDTCDCHKLVWSWTSLMWGWGDFGYTCPITRNESLSD